PHQCGAPRQPALPRAPGPDRVLDDRKPPLVTTPVSAPPLPSPAPLLSSGSTGVAPRLPGRPTPSRMQIAAMSKLVAQRTLPALLCLRLLSLICFRPTIKRVRAVGSQCLPFPRGRHWLARPMPVDGIQNASLVSSPQIAQVVERALDKLYLE